MVTSTTTTTTPTLPVAPAAPTNPAAAAAAATTQAAAPGGAMDKNAFLKLLVAQMQNQDPMNPMDGTQMATQLAQFSSLEQLQNINETLTNQQTSSTSLLGAVQATSAINTIGHTVMATGNGLQLGGTDGATSVTADIAANGASATLHILDASGKEVGTRDLGAVSAGSQQTITLGSAADNLPAGNYTYSIDVKAADGSAVSVQTYTTGRVTGVSSGTSGLTLTVAGTNVPYANVIKILN
ncbi:MAG TPA: flagellar hook capping FlgD N-terminal domain-containing protein [Gemmatimonadaceae bacterium]|nr:flagellar hook capping FlgD N-terminal domain-containing protein [Gemmatimonadaceae bacterium]